MQIFLFFKGFQLFFNRIKFIFNVFEDFCDEISYKE